MGICNLHFDNIVRHVFGDSLLLVDSSGGSIFVFTYLTDYLLVIKVPSQ